jgi:hypothetical protein
MDTPVLCLQAQGLGCANFGADSKESAMPKVPDNAGKAWSADDIAQLKKLAKENTPTRVIGLKLERTETAIYSKAADLDVSLKPANQSPYNRQKK